MASSTPNSGFSFAPASAQGAFSFQNNQSSSSSRQPLFSTNTSSNPFGATHNGSNGDQEMVNGNADGLDDDVGVTYLEPAAYKKNDRVKWKFGKTVAAAVSPVGGEVASWTTYKQSTNANQPVSNGQTQLTTSDKVIYFSSQHSLPDPLVDLYTESHLLFISLQQIVAESRARRVSSVGVTHGKGQFAEAWDKRGNLVSAENLLGPPDAETAVQMRRLADLYLDNLAELKGNTELDSALRARFTSLFNILSIAETLYLPVDGKGEGFIGEELLDWVNDVDPAPDNSLGNDIMATKNPWEHPSFWPYISRCILRGFNLPAASFLRSLTRHSHPPISKLANLLAQQLSVFPRSSEERWRVDLEFLQAHKSWLAKFRAELTSFIAGRPKGKWLDDGLSGSGQWSSWENDLRMVIELMEGKPNRILDEAADWREALGAWGVLVDVDMRRDHLPEIMSIILDKVPIDPTLPEDAIQSALCSADTIKALMGCYDLDVWLAAHLGDLLDKLELVPDDEQRFDIPLRDFFLLEYAEILQNNPKHSAFWRVVCDYLNYAGEEGRNRLRTHIRHIAINLEKSKTNTLINGDENMDVENNQGEGEGEEGIRLLDEIRTACIEFKLEDEFKTITMILAGRLTRNGDFGMAASMCMMAGDGFALSRIAERILDAYVEDGEEEFLRLVDTLPPTLLNEAPTALAQLQSQNESQNFALDIKTHSAISVFASRLTFLSEFRDYLLFILQGAKDRAANRLVNLLISGIAPMGFWAVLLVESIPLLEDSEILFSSNETFELLRVLEEVESNSSYAPEYLIQLETYLQRRRTMEKGINTTKNESNSKDNNSSEGKEEGRRMLEQVRLALARNLARAVVVGLDNPF